MIAANYFQKNQIFLEIITVINIVTLRKLILCHQISLILICHLKEYLVSIQILYLNLIKMLWDKIIIINYNLTHKRK